jgi:hypothetical protein
VFLYSAYVGYRLLFGTQTIEVGVYYTADNENSFEVYNNELSQVLKRDINFEHFGCLFRSGDVGQSFCYPLRAQIKSKNYFTAESDINKIRQVSQKYSFTISIENFVNFTGIVKSDFNP